MRSSTERFWAFSIRTYRRTGVPRACLNLQDDHGADVNMVLFCIWFGVTFGELEDDLFNQVLKFSRHWSKHTVTPLREIRRWLKAPDRVDLPVDTVASMEMRERVKLIELEAERLQQYALEACCRDLKREAVLLSSARTMSEENIRRYFETLPNGNWSSATGDITIILDAAIRRNLRDTVRA